jgi:hypothetical protein
MDKEAIQAEIERLQKMLEEKEQCQRPNFPIRALHCHTARLAGLIDPLSARMLDGSY